MDASLCLQPCNGLTITSFSKSEGKKNLVEKFPIISNYDKYQKITTKPKGDSYDGNINIICFWEKEVMWIEIIISGFEWKNPLRYVRIYFDTPTFDKITKDRAAKFVDMLSAVGGTMGLLTGFSIISGVEIAYFLSKIIFRKVKK